MLKQPMLGQANLEAAALWLVICGYRLAGKSGRWGPSSVRDSIIPADELGWTHGWILESSFRVIEQKMVTNPSWNRSPGFTFA